MIRIGSTRAECQAECERHIRNVEELSTPTSLLTATAPRDRAEMPGKYTQNVRVGSWEDMSWERLKRQLGFGGSKCET